jgi:hypothetical protein
MQRNTVDFPYSFPSASRYRIFIQVKHGSTLETGVFDASVQQAKSDSFRLDTRLRLSAPHSPTGRLD